MKLYDKVKAKTIITESGKGQGDPTAEFPSSDYIHALPGDIGEIVHIEDEIDPTVRFERTGTATLVCPDKEVEFFHMTVSSFVARWHNLMIPMFWDELIDVTTTHHTVDGTVKVETSITIPEPDAPKKELHSGIRATFTEECIRYMTPEIFDTNMKLMLRATLSRSLRPTTGEKA